MKPELDQEYSELQAFIDFFSTNVWGIDPSDPVHPTNAGKNILRKVGKSKALEGLRQAAHDIIESLRYETPEYISRLDISFRSANIITVSEVRHRYDTLYRRILQRGQVRNETEYYLIQGIVSDINIVTNEERMQLEKMLHDFETRA